MLPLSAAPRRLLAREADARAAVDLGVGSGSIVDPDVAPGGGDGEDDGAEP